MGFITKETFKAPPTAEVQALIPAEKAKVKELTEQGLIEAVYVAAAAETHKMLPLHPYMNSEITALSDEA